MRFAITLSLLAAPLLALAASPAHNALAHRRNSSPAANVLQKRISGSATWYQTGLGACGWWNNPGDFIVAMNSFDFPQDTYPSSICGKEISITGPMGTVTATVADMCPFGGGNCFPGDFDCSQGLFIALFGDLGVGKGHVEWYYTGGGGGTGAGGGGNNGGQQSTTPPPDPTTTPPPPSSTSSTEQPSSSSTPPSSSQSQTSSSAAPTTSASTNTTDLTRINLIGLNQYFVQLQGVLEKGFQLS